MKSVRARQTWALFVAAYRELNARKLFWLTIVLSGLVVGALSCVGIDEEGITIWPFGFIEDSEFFNSNVIAVETFYKIMFVSFGVTWWLGLGATALALVSTASIVPDLVSAGAVDVMLAKPISRTRLFLTKFATGLLFTALQVSVFALASFLVIGVRGGAWEWGLFLAVPFVVVSYSYLFSVCAVIGLVTRSAVAALLLTALFWMFLFGIHTSDMIVSFGRIASELELKGIEQAIAAEQANPTPATKSSLLPDQAPEDGETVQMEDLQTALAEQQADNARWQTAYFWLHGSKTVLPKVTETLALLERVLVEKARLPQSEEDRESRRGPGARIFGLGRVKRAEYDTAVEADEASRGVVWTIGTSLLFEAAVLALATWRFNRRDF